jgi:hypothetical protein
MLTPLFSRMCSVRYVGCQNLRHFVFPLTEVESKLVKDIQTRIENNNIIVSFFIGDKKRIFEIPPKKN